MNPLTVAITVIAVFSAVAGVIIGETLIIPRLASRRDAFVAAGSGMVTLVGFVLAAALTEGYIGLVLHSAPITMVFVCTMGTLSEAIFGFRRHNCS